MGTNFWELLHQRQDQLTRSGHAVADYLLQHADEAQYLSISSLARECNVAEATVFRFCRALGFDGYHEMRIALAQANATGTPSSQRELQPGATTAELCEHAYARFLTAINGTQNALSTEAVDEARTPDAGGQAGVLPRTGRQYAPGKRHLRPLRQPFHQVPHRRRQPFTAADCQSDERGRRCALRLLLRRDPRHDGDTAHRQGRRGKNHPPDPLRGLPRRIARRMSSFSAAQQESPLDSGSIPIKAAFLYVGEVLVLRYMLDDPAHSNTAQDLTSEALTVKML